MDMAINRKMFAEIHGLITEFPELHDQQTWEVGREETGKCGTTRCIAGWATWIAARDHGLLSRKRETTTEDVRHALAGRLGLVMADRDSQWYYGDYDVADYPVIGGHLLGLSSDEAYSLFHDMDDERVVARVKSYAETGEDISEEEFERYDD
jgi:hypothetical protein